MTASGSPPDAVPSDQLVGAALRLTRLWRRLAEHHTWRPIADAAAVRATLGSLGWPRPRTTDRRDRGPVLIRAGHAAREWINRQGHADPLAHACRHRAGTGGQFSTSRRRRRWDCSAN